jgi:hypothetical protein
MFPSGNPEIVNLSYAVAEPVGTWELRNQRQGDGNWFMNPARCDFQIAARKCV